MNKLVLMDLDLTLIDRGYNLTVPLDQIRPVVAAAKMRGITMGLNSDSPYESLRRWYDSLGLNGPIISERGARVYLPDWPTPIDFSSPGASLFPRLREDFIKNLPSVCSHVLCGDANNLQAQPRPDPVGDKFIIVNGYRERSISFFARQVGPDGKLIAEPDLLKKAASLLNDLAQKYPLLWEERDIDDNPDYCIYIMHSRISQKHSTVVRLLNEFNLEQLWMVGDNLPDFIDDLRVNHVAVANARDTFKAKAKIITAKPITEGVLEFLEALA